MLFELLRDLIWGLPTVGLIFGFGLYFTVKSRCIQLAGFKTLLRETFSGSRRTEKGGISTLTALSTALGGTGGIGRNGGGGVGGGSPGRSPLALSGCGGGRGRA